MSFSSFKKDKLNKAYSEEMTNILRSIDPNEIPDDYEDLEVTKEKF